MVPPFPTRISRVVGDVGVLGGEWGNVQTGRGNRMSIISHSGCSTSVVLATGPTEEETPNTAAMMVNIWLQQNVMKSLKREFSRYICRTNGLRTEWQI